MIDEDELDDILFSGWDGVPAGVTDISSDST